MVAARYCDGTDEDGRNTYNVLDLALADGVPPPDPSVERNFYTTSSCGVCGKASIDAIRTRTAWPPAGDPVRLDPAAAAIGVAEIDRLIAKRKQARAERDFAASDAIRDELAAKGVEVMDGDALGWEWKLAQ